MKKILLLGLLIVTSFGLGYAFNNLILLKSKNKMKKVTGIGGVFFKCQDPAKIKEWYNKHLGIDAGSWGAQFEWRELDDSTKKGATAWNPFPDKTKYFDPSTKDFMINYRVENLEALVADLKKDGVTICDEIATYPYGKFVHIMDMEGNKIELWEPKEE
jgi:predicted enzyme related to lactoylglutathione lyase